MMLEICLFQASSLIVLRISLNFSMTLLMTFSAAISCLNFVPWSDAFSLVTKSLVSGSLPSSHKSLTSIAHSIPSHFPYPSNFTFTSNSYPILRFPRLTIIFDYQSLILKESLLLQWVFRSRWLWVLRFYTPILQHYQLSVSRSIASPSPFSTSCLP